MYDYSVDSFEWDDEKDRTNREKHGISFEEAQLVFKDPKRIIAVDTAHSAGYEKRLYCIGQVERGIVTVRFTCRKEKMRLIGAGFWRKGRKAYEETN